MAQEFTLPDGRNMDYFICGAEDGFPLVWIHGTPGAYPPYKGLVSICEKKGVKLIMITRAGYGGSTRQKGRQVIDVVPDIQALKEHLGIEKCFVGGRSGGGPHSLACAARLPGCIAALCLSTVAPWEAEGLDFFAGQGQSNVEEFNAALKGEEVLRKFCEPMRLEMLKEDSSSILEALASLLPDVDRDAITKSPEMGQFLHDTLQESLRIGIDGWVDDDMCFIQPWGFELSEIKVPVLVYHGTVDKLAPVAHGEWVADNLPQDIVRKHIVQGEGHLSLFLEHTDKMIDELLSIAKL